MKNLSIFEPQIEKHYALKKTCIIFRLCGFELSEGAFTCKSLKKYVFLYRAIPVFSSSPAPTPAPSKPVVFTVKLWWLLPGLTSYYSAIHVHIYFWSMRLTLFLLGFIVTQAVSHLILIWLAEARISYCWHWLVGCFLVYI